MLFAVTVHLSIVTVQLPTVTANMSENPPLVAALLLETTLPILIYGLLVLVRGGGPHRPAAQPLTLRLKKKMNLQGESV